MAARGDQDLKALIRRDIPERRKVSPLAGGSWIRISGLAMLCAREEVLCSRHGVIRDDHIDADLMMIFEHGNGLHWDLQNRILPLTKTLYGRWLCGTCGTFHGGRDQWMVGDQFRVGLFSESQIQRPDVCPNCKSVMTSDNSLYVEQHIKNPVYRLMGHPDGFIHLDGFSGLGVLEIKSISSKGAYEVRNCPKLDHIVQSQSYMWLTGCQWGKVLYWDKGASGMKGLVEHTVEYDEDHVEAIQNLVRDIWKGVEDQSSKLPERICASSECKRAEHCSSVELCFQEAA